MRVYTAIISSDVRYPPASLDLECSGLRGSIGNPEIVPDVDLEDFPADRNVQVWLPLIVGVGAAALKVAGLKRGFYRRVVVAVVVNDGRIIEGEILHPDSRPRLRESAAHRRVDRPRQLVGLNE